MARSMPVDEMKESAMIKKGPIPEENFPDMYEYDFGI